MDSVLLYNPARKMLFATYHQKKPLKPTSELMLYADSVTVYYEELAKAFGLVSTMIDDGCWENGPQNSAYNNVRYKPGKKQVVLLQRIPYCGQDIAIFQILKTAPKHGHWWMQYPIGPYCGTDLGDTDNIDIIALFLHNARTAAVANLRLSKETNPKQ